MKLKELRHNCWNIGFFEGGLENLISDKKNVIHWAKKTINDRWFADPFILDISDTEIVVLAEEYSYGLKRGRLARVVYDRKTYEEKGYTILLDLPTHLSFPFIFRYEGHVYIIPENSASGCSSIYEYDNTSQKLKFLNIVSNEPFTDATLFSNENQVWLLTTKTPDQNGRELMIYKFDVNNLCVCENDATVVFPDKIARNAGEVFTVNGKYYRPAQDCADSYGHGIVIQEITHNEGAWCFSEIRRIYPDSYRYNQGIHTLNHYKDMVVFDARGFRYPLVGRIANLILKHVKHS